ncbi:MAG: response regulator [Lachnospiraceae bacterium]|nr:response regulator [Lachnospiraceae bacterium]
MRHKVLLTGNNETIINEFFTYMDLNFECISTSQRYDDIMNHLKYVSPDAFVYCPFNENFDDLKRFANVARKISDEEIPIVVIGNPSDCSELTKIAPAMKATVLHKPISSANIQRAIEKIFEEKRELQKDTEEVVAVAEKIQKTEKYTARKNNTLRRRADEGPEVADQLKKMPERKHILIVDDDSSVLKMLKGYLSERYDVATAINGKVAVRFLETKRTDLVLLDYEMPMENGASVLRRIRSNRKTADLPVVFLTGVTDGKKIQEVMALKPQGYLLKPIEMEKLSSTIKGILN